MCRFSRYKQKVTQAKQIEPRLCDPPIHTGNVYADCKYRKEQGVKNKQANR